MSYICAGDGTRTRTPFRIAGLKSAAATNYATPASCQATECVRCHTTDLNTAQFVCMDPWIFQEKMETNLSRLTQVSRCRHIQLLVRLPNQTERICSNDYLAWNNSCLASRHESFKYCAARMIGSLEYEEYFGARK